MAPFWKKKKKEEEEFFRHSRATWATWAVVSMGQILARARRNS
jgi:hypothetical protein